MLSTTIRPALFAALLTLLASGTASAQTFLSGTVKLVVPVPAGGVTDTMARIVAQRLTDAWGQPVVVDNRPGGNYAVGAIGEGIEDLGARILGTAPPANGTRF